MRKTLKKRMNKILQYVSIAAKAGKAFGGEIYKTNGSHGCVNLPHDVAEQLFGMVDVGTVVIVH